MKRLGRVLGWLALGLSVGYLISVGLDHLATVRGELRWTASTTVGLGAAVALYSVVLVLGGLAWAHLLRGAGYEVSWQTALLIVLRSNVAKYLPGNVGQFAGRVVLAHRVGVPTATVLGTLTFEAVLTVVAAVLFAAICAPQSLRSWLAVSNRSEGLLAISLAGVVLLLGIAVSLAWYSSKSQDLASGGAKTVRQVALARILASLALYIVGFAFLGAAAVALARGALPLSQVPYWPLAGSFAAAWVAGFVTPGAPGGVGVREAILVATLDPVIGGAEALALALLLRLATVLGDGLAFILSAAWRRFGRVTTA